jgi:hypothetical protein
MPYPGGVGAYRQKCNDIAEAGYTGFTLHDGQTLVAGAASVD